MKSTFILKEFSKANNDNNNFLLQNIYFTLNPFFGPAFDDKRNPGNDDDEDDVQRRLLPLCV